MKSVLLAATLLLPLSMTAAIAQSTAPSPAAPAAAPKPVHAVKPKPKPVHHAAPAAATTPETLDIVQILDLRQIDPATYEIDARLQDGSPVSLRMNAFVMQGLGVRLGTFGKSPH
ncbi:hypothetical protein BH11PSE4_BH11PSE4_37080 [soil metagenome]